MNRTVAKAYRNGTNTSKYTWDTKNIPNFLLSSFSFLALSGILNPKRISERSLMKIYLIQVIGLCISYWKIEVQKRNIPHLKAFAVMPEPGNQGGHWPPQYLADQLTLFEQGRADYPHLLLLASTNVFHLPASL